MSQHQLALPNGETIAYQLERRQRRTIGLKISPQGLVVHVPNRLPLLQLEQLLISKVSWIQKKLSAQQDKATPEIKWEDGTTLLLLGNNLQLNVSRNPRNKVPEHSPGMLLISLPQPEDSNAIARKVLQWYRKLALSDFARRLELFAAKLGVNTPDLYLSNAQSRWGSCNSKQEIRLNWRLIQAPPHIINYVICHELAHLKEMNHSKKFWAHVEKLYPEYLQAEKDLKMWAHKLHAIDLCH